MIAIINISPDEASLTGINKYRVQINRKVICEFEHNRTHDGLAQCLRDAADAVDAHRNKSNITPDSILALLGEMG